MCVHLLSACLFGTFAFRNWFSKFLRWSYCFVLLPEHTLLTWIKFLLTFARFQFGWDFSYYLHFASIN